MAERFEAVIPRSKIGTSPSAASIVPLADGRLMWVWGAGGAQGPLQPLRANYSGDGGRSWTDPTPARLETGGELASVFMPSLARLSSGALGLTHISEHQKHDQVTDSTQITTFHLSRDGGDRWTDGVQVNQGFPGSREEPKWDALVQLTSGRIVLPFQQRFGPTPTPGAGGLFRRFGQDFSNVFSFSLSFCMVYYSDDEGATWSRSRNEVCATIERGVGGSYSMTEPHAAELADGRLLMLGRTNLGRLFRAYSEDGGESWGEAEPTDLVLRVSPFTLKRIPDTSDLLVIWNQISPWEAMLGLYRHRLSCAISTDGGVTWQHHKNLESLDDVSYIEPEPERFQMVSKGARQPLDRRRYHRAPGPLRVDHPYCTFHDGNAVIAYSVGVLGDPSVITDTYGMDFEEVAGSFGMERRSDDAAKVLGVNKVNVVPTDWLYS